MKLLVRLVIGSLLLVALVFSAPSRQVINFQGYLTDKNGQPVFGTRQMGFNVYSVSSGGSALFSITTRTVTIYNGNYATKLDLTDTQLAQLDNGGQVWLEVIVNGANMTPRIQMVAVPFAANVRGIDIGSDNKVSFNINQLKGGTINNTVIANATIIGGSLDTNGGSITAGPIIATQINVAGKVKENGNDLVPQGAIIMWSGTQVPAGWALCDGTNGTPDLRNRFIVGSGTNYTIGATGGQDSITLSVAQIPAHTHTGSASSELGKHSHSYADNYFVGENNTWTGGGAAGGGYTGHNALATGQTTGEADLSHTHSITIGSAGSGLPFDNRPAYYALAYIMKL